jgi:branched-subunit amino acid transport protein
VNLGLVGLAALMGLVTYPSRAVPLLVPGIERLPRVLLTYLRLVGPAVLASLAAVDVAITTSGSGRPMIHLGVEWLAVAAAVALMAWRRNLLLGLVCAVVVTALARATGLAG